jgi:hypothetical protein
MNIRDLDEISIHRSHLKNVRPTPADISRTSASAPNQRSPSRDEADTSALSRMMAQSKVDLNLQLSVRPDRIESLKKFVELPADLPDSVIDEVTRRLP